VLSVEEVALLLRAASGPKHKAAFATAYGAGLRVSEAVALKVGGAALRSAIARCTSAAHRTASTTLANSACIPSPVFFTIRRCSSIFGSTSSRRWAWSRSCVPLAHQPRVTGYIGGKDRGEAAGLGHDRVGPPVEVGDRLCSLIVTAGYRWIKSQAWIPDLDTCEPLASLE
jgi:hypothetical protein